MVAHRVYSAPVDRATSLIRDQTIALDGPRTLHDYPEHRRRVRFRDPETGEGLAFLTNQVTLPALTICALYKSRWQVDIDQAWRLSRIKGWVGSICNEAFWVKHRGSVLSSVRIRAADRQAIADQRGRAVPTRRRGVRRARCRQDWRAGCRAIPDIGRGSPRAC